MATVPYFLQFQRCLLQQQFRRAASAQLHPEPPSPRAGGDIAFACAAVRVALGEGHAVLAAIVDAIAAGEATDETIDLVDLELVALLSVRGTSAAEQDALRTRVWLTHSVLGLACAARCDSDAATLRHKLAKMSVRFAARAVGESR